MEGKCWQTLRKKVDECRKRLNTEQNVQLQRLQKALEQKNKVNKINDKSPLRL